MKWSGLLCLAPNYFQVTPELGRRKQPRKMMEQRRPGVARLLVWCKGSGTIDPVYLQEKMI